MTRHYKLVPVLASALALALATQAAGAAGASAVITGMSGAYLQLSIQSRHDFCAARFKNTQAAWAGNLARWQQRNTEVLAELRAIAERLESAAQSRTPQPSAPQDGSAAPLHSDAAALATLQQFKLMAAMAPASNLAPLPDDKAAYVCGQWLSDLEPAGKVEQALPVLLDAARKLQPAQR